MRTYDLTNIFQMPIVDVGGMAMLTINRQRPNNDNSNVLYMDCWEAGHEH